MTYVRPTSSGDSDQAIRRSSQPLLFVDINTTPDGRIIEISAIRFDEALVPDGQFSAFVRPSRFDLHHEIWDSRVHQIRPKHLVHAPLWLDVLPKLLRLADGAMLVSHDMEPIAQAIRTESAAYGIVIPNQQFSVRDLHENLVPSDVYRGRYAIRRLALEFNLCIKNAHHTRKRAILTAQCMNWLLASNMHRPDLASLVQSCIRD